MAKMKNQKILSEHWESWKPKGTEFLFRNCSDIDNMPFKSLRSVENKYSVLGGL